MNRVYRTVFNRALGVWQAVAETARGRSKASRGRTRRRAGAVLRLAAAGLAVHASLPAALAQALPTGAAVVRGQASIARSGSGLTVSQGSRNAVINWNSFSVGKGGAVHFNNGTGATLNRVTGKLPSRIDGALSATGSLYLMNQNGVLVGPNGTIRAAGFLASTLDVGDDEFMAGGGLRFSGASQAGVVNLGSIRAESGNVTLVGHSVHNAGEIRSPQGSADLLAAQEIFLASPQAPALLVSLPAQAGAGAGTGASNAGLIEAAQARLQAANGNLYALAINQSGVIRATGAKTLDGRIVLTADGGAVQQDGKLSARNADGSGGAILVGGDFRGGNSAVANAARTTVTANADMDASAAADAKSGGRVVVWADDSTSFAGRIAARAGAAGGDGGFVEVSGKHQLDFRPAAPIDLSAPAGKAGTVLLDPDQIEVVASASGPNQVAVADIEAGLASANYVLTTSNFDPHNGDGDITVSNDLNWTSANTLRLESGNGININANITGTAGGLELYAGGLAFPPGEDGLPTIYGGIALAADKTIHVDTLRFGTNAASLPAGYTLLDEESNSTLFIADGTLRVNTLELDFADGAGAGLVAENAQNAIGALRSTGSGNLGVIALVDGEGDLRVRLDSADSTGNGVYIVTPGDLTLEAGSYLSYAPSPFAPEVALASTGGNFINEAGSGVFGDNMRFLIYTGTRAATTKGGLTGTDEFSRSYTGNPPSDYAGDSTSRFLFRQAEGTPELTYRADDLSRLYGDANPALTYTVTGLLDGDRLADAVTGTPLLSTSATLRSGVNSYVIDISRGSLASSSYDFLFAPGTLTVNRAPLTLDIDNLDRYYGAANPALTARVSGLKAGDTAAAILAGWQLETGATSASNAGGYGIDASWLGTGSENYIYTVNPGMLTVRPAPVTVMLGPTSRMYGDANPDFLALASLSGAFNGDSVATAFPGSSFGTAASAGSSVGTYAVSGSGFNNPNYVVTVGSLGALAVTKAPLVINANDASRLYGDADPAFSLASATGWRNGDTLASIPGLVLVSATDGSTPVGSHAIVPAGSATNYEFVPGSGTLTIDKAPLQVRIDAASRYYGDADPSFGVSYVGLKNGEAGIAGVSVSSAADIRAQVGNYPLTASAPDAQNYDVVFYGNVLAVKPRPLTVTANDAIRTYGAANPLFSVSVGNATSWDAAQAANYWVADTEATQRSDVGSYAIGAGANPYGHLFDNLANYAVTLQPGALTVTRAPVTVRAEPLSILWGDGRPPFAYTMAGLMPWDSMASAGTPQLTSLAGGTNAAPGRYAVRLASTGVGRNYVAALDGTPFVDVLRRPITITGNYSTSGAQLQQIHEGEIEPFTVKRYDSDGNLSTYTTTAPLAGGPQFSAKASSDGTRGEGLFSFVSNAFIEPAAGASLEDVLRYYDPVSKPGVATTSLGTSENIIQRDVLPPEAEVIVVNNPNGTQLHLRDLTVPGEAPSIRNLVEDAFPDSDAMMREIQALFAMAAGTGQQSYTTSKMLGNLSLELKQELMQAAANQSAWAWLQQEAADTEKWMAELAAARPRASNYDALMASARRDLASTRAEMDAMPTFEKIRQQLMAGDPELLRQFVPVMTSSLLQAQKKGELAPDTQAALVQLINEQRSKTIAAADAKYEAIVGLDRGLVAAASAPKIPDIVGDAYVKVSTDQTAQAAGTIGAAGAGGAIVAGLTFTTTLMELTGFGQGASFLLQLPIASAAGPLVIGAAAAAIGVAEAVQVIESTKNYDRYVAYKAANKQLTSLDALDMSNPDNMMQMATAMSALLASSVGRSQP